MSIDITTLIEDTQDEKAEYIAEHGVSFFIEKGASRILFDTGQSDAFLHNADKMGVDVSTVDTVMLSHNHFDHSGGLTSFIERHGENFTLYLGRGFFDPKYAIEGANYRFAGGDFDEEYIDDRGIRLEYVDAQVNTIGEGIHIISRFNRNFEWKIPDRFVIKEDDVVRQDSFDDEISLVLESKKGLIVILGCSHPGVINILQTVKENFQEKIHCVIGGTHLMDADEEQLELAVNYFTTSEIDLIGVSHCTGERATQRLKESLGSRFFENITGTILHFKISERYRLNKRA